MVEPRWVTAEDQALLGTEAPDEATFLACYQGIHPNFGTPDSWLTYAGGTTADQALARARKLIGRGFSFTVERLAANDAAWPEEEPIPARRYALSAGRYVILVPSPWRGSLPEPSVQAAVAAVGDDEAWARAQLATLGVRALAGRIAAVVDLDMGYETYVLRKGGAQERR